LKILAPAALTTTLFFTLPQEPIFKGLMNAF
jgi:hypothetical protein